MELRGKVVTTEREKYHTPLIMPTKTVSVVEAEHQVAHSDRQHLLLRELIHHPSMLGISAQAIQVLNQVNICSK